MQSIARNICFVLVPRFNMMTMTMLIEPMRIANYLAPAPLFSWDFRSPDPGRVTASNGLSVACTALDAAEGGEPDITIVCGSWGCEHYSDRGLFRWLRRQFAAKRKIVAVEIGVYILARAGLLTDHKVTTHWSMLAGLAEAYPKLDVCEQLYTTTGRLMTCAGGTAGLDLMLHIIAEGHGEQLAAEIAKQMMHHPRRPAQALQRLSAGGAHEDVHPDVRSALSLLEERIVEPASVPQLCQELGISQRKLERLFRRDTGCSIVQYGKLLRLQHARVLLSTTRLSIREVSAACGFNSMSYFSMSFAETFGKKPSEYRQAWPEHEASPSWPGTVYAFTQSPRPSRGKAR